MKRRVERKLHEKTLHFTDNRACRICVNKKYNPNRNMRMKRLEVVVKKNMPETPGTRFSRDETRKDNVQDFFLHTEKPNYGNKNKVQQNCFRIRAGRTKIGRNHWLAGELYILKGGAASSEFEKFGRRPETRRGA